jgi:hypothetical protein
MVDLMWSDLMFCQCFLSRETKKLMPTANVSKRSNERVKTRTEHDVSEDLVLSHLGVADGDTQAQHLLQLELDGRADLSELGAEVLGVRHGGGELARLGETGTEQTGDLLDEGLGG